MLESVLVVLEHNQLDMLRVLHGLMKGVVMFFLVLMLLTVLLLVQVQELEC